MCQCNRDWLNGAWVNNSAIGELEMPALEMGDAIVSRPGAVSARGIVPSSVGSGPERGERRMADGSDDLVQRLESAL